VFEEDLHTLIKKYEEKYVYPDMMIQQVYYKCPEFLKSSVYRLKMDSIVVLTLSKRLDDNFVIFYRVPGERELTTFTRSSLLTFLLIAIKRSKVEIR